jgi:hypothetical protein
MGATVASHFVIPNPFKDRCKRFAEGSIAQQR